MDKKSFLNVLHQYSRGSVTEALDIIALKQLYPYSQILHVLAARLSKDHGFSTQQEELQSAAVYSSDRVVLKEAMNSTAVNFVPEPSDIQSVVQKENLKVNAPADTKSSTAEIKITSSVNEIDLADKIANDLQLLSESRHNFELMFAEIAAKKDEVDQQLLEDYDKEVKASERTSILSDIEKDKSGKSKKERIIEIAKELEANRSLTEKSQYPIKKKKDSGDGLIDEIASSKKEINPETDKQKAQIEIINSFIKAQPTLINTKDKPLPVPSGDLSIIKSGEFGDNIVSETLVDILIKQGKKDKAIEVLKKLIWKFPQKKAYFATQIEELKK